MKPPFSGVLCALAALAFSSCEVQRQVAFNPADFPKASLTGNGSVVGRAFVIMKDYLDRPVRNSTIDLAPVNAYLTEDMRIAFARNRKLSRGDPRAQKYVRTVPTDEEGNFEFHHLPAGEYYLGTTVDWSHSYYDGDSNLISVGEDVPLYTRVTVRDGQTIKVTDWSYGRQKSR
jgi:hypothetical protein